MNFDELTNQIIGRAIEMHRYLGLGLLEFAYKICLVYELKTNELQRKTEAGVPVVYKGVKLDCGYRIDLLIENKLVIELKCVEELTGIYFAQALTYMKLGNYSLGLVFNFYLELLKQGGIKRLVDKY